MQLAKFKGEKSGILDVFERTGAVKNILGIIARTIAGYDPMVIPTTRTGLERGPWLKSKEDIVYDGEDINNLISKDFKRIPVTGDTNIALKFIANRISFLRRLERRPVFIHELCIGCAKCIKICPEKAIEIKRKVFKKKRLNL